jgi:hypothetical protein
MLKSPRFNYIITIHNKENLIEKVLTHVLMCCRENSHIYPVLDGCTDNTETVVDSILKKLSSVPITKVYTHDVHELLSINAGIRASDQNGEGFNIILQDDVLLADFSWEKKVKILYDWAGERLGYVSFRLGANFLDDAATSQDSVPYTNYIENAYGHGIPDALPLLPGHLAYRTVPIKSPVCIPFKLIRDVGLYDERLAPYGHDDLDYAIRVIKAGYKNAVFPLRFYSDIKWGGTRLKQHPDIQATIQRNMDRLRCWHKDSMKAICEGAQPEQIVEVSGMCSKEESDQAQEAWRVNVNKLKSFQREGIFYSIARGQVISKFIRRLSRRK